MSLSRLALRLAAYEALNPFATISSGPWPTLAGKNVYDTRLDPIETPDQIEALLSQIEGAPIVTLYTEEQENEPYAGADYPAERTIVVLVAELMIAARGELQVVNADGSTQTFGAISAPITDRQHEALLDVLEAQVRRLLDPLGYAPSGAIYRQYVVFEGFHIHSVPQRSADRETRLAARTLKFRLRLRTEQWPAFGVSPAPTGLDLLPQPLQNVAKALPAGSTGAQLCAEIAATLQQPGAATPLQGIDFFASFGRPTAPTKADGSDSDLRASVDTTVAPPTPLLNRLWLRFSAWIGALVAGDNA